MSDDRPSTAKARGVNALVIVAWSLVLLSMGVPASAQQETADEDVARLIEQLGDPRYAERRDARRRLLSVGLVAFDDLRAARTHPDPEVADTCELLLEELTSELGWLDDPPLIRQWLEKYSRSDAEQRRDGIRMLALASRPGVARALVRIARFEPSDRLAREAVAALLSSREYERPARRRDAIRSAVAEIDAKHGPGDRPAARWLQLAATPRSADAAPETLAEAWRREAFAERARLESRPRQTSFEIVANLYWEWLRAALREESVAAADSAAVTTVESLPEESTSDTPLRITRALLWASAAQRPRVVDGLLERYGERLQDKRGLYLRARIALDRGDEARAAGLAEEALEASVLAGSAPSTSDFGPGIAVAEELRRAGYADWARAEYAAIGTELDPLTNAAVWARWRLAESLHDAARYAEAAETLGGLSTAIRRTPTARRQYRKLDVAKEGAGRQGLSEKTISSRRHLAAGLAARRAGDRAAEVSSLKAAITDQPDDADILIAMHQVADPPRGFADDTRRRITELCLDFELAIAQYPTRAESFNGWAWLVSNTEGDFEKAVRYSRRSLEIEPDNPGLLDTLGRCLFSVGQVDEAVRVQRRAVELEPTMLVMQRQLAEFEAALDAEGESTP